MSLQTADAEAAAHAVAPRVALADIEAAVSHRYHFTAGEAVVAMQLKWNDEEQRYELRKPEPVPALLCILSICILVMKNGFTVVGKSAPASPENFNAEFGKKLAYEDCIRQLWPLMGFALRDKLAASGQ